MPNRERQEWVPALIVAAAAHAIVGYLLANPQLFSDRAPRLLTVAEVSLIEFVPPSNHVVPLRERETAARTSSVPATKPASTDDLGTGPAAASAGPADYVEPVYRAAKLNNPPPAYPPAARRHGIQGTVLLRAEVHREGHCRNVAIQRSSGHEILDRAAVHAVQQWHFIPARRGAQPIDAWIEIPVTFRIEG